MGIILFNSEDCNHTYFQSISCYCHIFISLGLMNLLLISYKTCFGIFVWKLILNWSSVCLRVHFPSLGSPHCDQRFCRGVHQAHWVSEWQGGFYWGLGFLLHSDIERVWFDLSSTGASAGSCHLWQSPWATDAVFELHSWMRMASPDWTPFWATWRPFPVLLVLQDLAPKASIHFSKAVTS